MRKIYLAAVLFAVYWTSNAQTIYPGGVPGVTSWNITQQDVSVLNGELDNNQKKSFSLFLVYQQTPIEEPQYRIFTYTLNEPDTTGENLLLKIDKQPFEQTIPIKNFKGYISETILYDRVLSWNERQRVESYLAVKYGISIDQTFPTSYFNSTGSIIWNANQATGFNYNITAIGRDDRSGLLQNSSTSSREPGLLRVSTLKKAVLPDHAFLVWADNGGDLQFIPQKGQWKQTGRKWKINQSGDISQWNVTQEFDLNQLSNRSLNKGEHYALMIDHSGSGKFPIGQVSFVETQPEKNKLSFPNLVWRNNANNSEVFSLVILPELFARYGVDNPSCGQNNGKLQIEINGGLPPYSIQLIDKETTTKLTSVTATSSLYTLPTIAQGDYVLQIKDAQGISFNEEIRVESMESQQIAVASDYIIQPGESITLSVPSSVTGFYQWQLPDGQISQDAQINIGQAGTYYIVVRNNEGCESSKRIDVTSIRSDFSRLNLYPNPTTDGHFRLDIGLYQASDVDLKIYNAIGGLVSQSKLSGSSYYLYNGNLPQTGHYIIQVTSNGTSESLKVIKN
jgi:hypothetical protein